MIFLENMDASIFDKPIDVIKIELDKTIEKYWQYQDFILEIAWNKSSVDLYGVKTTDLAPSGTFHIT